MTTIWEPRQCRGCDILINLFFFSLKNITLIWTVQCLSPMYVLHPLVARAQVSKPAREVVGISWGMTHQCVIYELFITMSRGVQFLCNEWALERWTYWMLIYIPYSVVETGFLLLCRVLLDRQTHNGNSIKQAIQLAYIFDLPLNSSCCGTTELLMVVVFLLFSTDAPCSAMLTNSGRFSQLTINNSKSG